MVSVSMKRDSWNSYKIHILLSTVFKIGLMKCHIVEKVFSLFVGLYIMTKAIRENVVVTSLDRTLHF